MRRWQSGLGLALLLFARVSTADEAGGENAERLRPGHELGNARLSASAVKINGFQTDSGPGLSYGGWSFNDLDLLVQGFGPGNFGGLVEVNRTAYSLNAGKQRLLTASPLRAALGPSGRVHAGPLTFELTLGYELTQAAAYGSSLAPAFSPAARSSVVAQGRVVAGLDFGGVEVFGRFPYALATTLAGHPGLKGSGYSYGAALMFNLFEASPVLYRLGARYEALNDALSAPSPSPLKTSQTANQFGLVLEAALVSPHREAATTGALELRVTQGVRAAALPGVRIVLTSGSGARRELQTDATGTLVAEDLEPGRYQADAAAAGFKPGTTSVTVTAGARARGALALEKARPTTGSLRVRALDPSTHGPPPRAQVKMAGGVYPLGDDGTVSIADLRPGAFSVMVSAPGYLTALEAGVVVAGQETSVEIRVFQEKKAEPATLSGSIRSTRGKSLPASLEIPELELRTRAGAEGRFSLRVDAGTYRVIITAPGFIGQTKTVTLKPGDQVIFNVDLHPVRP